MYDNSHYHHLITLGNTEHIHPDIFFQDSSYYRFEVCNFLHFQEGNHSLTDFIFVKLTKIFFQYQGRKNQNLHSHLILSLMTINHQSYFNSTMHEPISEYKNPN